MIKIFNKFPREMAFPNRKGPYRIVYNEKEFNEVVNKLNGKKNLYTTIYSFSRLKHNERNVLVPDYTSAVIDKLFFDFDTKNSFENIKKFHGYLLVKNIQHTILFSGGGFHLYIFCKKNNFMFPKDCIDNAQRQLAKEINLTIGNPNNEIVGKPIKDEKGNIIIFDIDESTIGDLARIGRIPHTYNLKRKRWCIPLLYTDLKEKTFDEIKGMAKDVKSDRLGKSPKIYGRELFDLKIFDYKKKEEEIETINDIPLLGEIKNISKENLWPCVENMIVKRSGCYAWYWATVWFREKGYTKKETDEIMKKYLIRFKRTDGTRNDYWHWKYSDRHLDNVYNDKEDKHWFPSAQHLFKKGFCPGKCKNYKEGGCLYFDGVK